MASGYQKRDVPVEEIPEVEDLVEAQERLNDFVQRNQAVILEYQGYLEDVNTAAERAKAVVRDMCGDAYNPVGVSCGPVKFLRFSPKVDAGVAYEMLGPGIYAQINGKAEQKYVYTLDAKDISRAVASGQIPRGIEVDRFLHMTPCFSVEK